MASCTALVASEEYADFIIRHSNYSVESIYESVGTNCVDVVNREFAVVYAPLEEVLPISFKKYSYPSVPKLYSLLDTTSMDAAGITPTFSQPNLSSQGEGTIIGIIDTGIDYLNPIFQNPDGTTRILGIWDQTLPRPEELANGVQPGISTEFLSTDFLYGQEFSKEKIDEALASENPLEIVESQDTNGHGTFLAGIAGGSETPDGSFFGAAPFCNLCIVKLKPAKQYLRDFYRLRDDAVAYQENDIMMGIKYLMLMAARFRMPITLLIGLGTNQGSHDGTSPLGQFLRTSTTVLGSAAVIAAGNEAGFRHHFFGTIPQNKEYEDAEIRVDNDENGFTLELWSRDPELYTVGFISPTGEQIQRIPSVLGEETRITFLLEQTVITVNYKTSEIGSGSQLVFMRFQNPTPGIWRVRVYNTLFITGQFHIWLPVRGFISDETVFLRADPDTTITDPGNTPTPITVSAYNHENESIYIHSSRGYSRDGEIKPEIAAPGVDVYGPGVAFTDGGGRRLPGMEQDTAPSFPMVRRTGSSIAAAHTAGAVADLFSWGLKNGMIQMMNQISVKSYLIRGARRETVYSYPNREWGYGKLDLYNTYIRLRE